MVQSLKRMRYFTGSQRRQFKKGLDLLKREALQTTRARQFCTRNVPVRKIAQKGMAIVKMTSD